MYMDMQVTAHQCENQSKHLLLTNVKSYSGFCTKTFEVDRPSFFYLPRRNSHSVNKDNVESLLIHKCPPCFSTSSECF